MSMTATPQVVAPEDGPGALEYRRFTRVPHATATVRFRFLQGDFEKFQDFYLNDLKRGHKWFALNLPSAAGILPHAVRCITHRSAPSMGYDYREVTMQIEIRGRRVYEDDLEGPEAGAGDGIVLLWLDQFNGAPVPLSEHPQDIPLSGSTWANYDGMLWLTGSGSAWNEGEYPGEHYPQGSRTYFTSLDEKGTHLATGWRFEVDFTVTEKPSDSDEGGANLSLGFSLRSLDDTSYGFGIHHSNETDVMRFSMYGPAESSYLISSPLGNYAVVLTNVTDTFDYELRVNGTLVTTFTNASWNYSIRDFDCFFGSNSHCTINRAALFGAIGEAILEPPPFTTLAWFSVPIDPESFPERSTDWFEGNFETISKYYGGMIFAEGDSGPVEFELVSWESTETLDMPPPTLTSVGDGLSFELTPTLNSGVMEPGIAIIGARKTSTGELVRGRCLIEFFRYEGMDYFVYTWDDS